jgi:hypothetical protein
MAVGGKYLTIFNYRNAGVVKMPGSLVGAGKTKE